MACSIKNQALWCSICSGTLVIKLFKSEIKLYKARILTVKLQASLSLSVLVDYYRDTSVAIGLVTTPKYA